jgi:hypothetical protein
MRIVGGGGADARILGAEGEALEFLQQLPVITVPSYVHHAQTDKFGGAYVIAKNDRNTEFLVPPTCIRELKRRGLVPNTHEKEIV